MSEQMLEYSGNILMPTGIQPSGLRESEKLIEKPFGLCKII